MRDYGTFYHEDVAKKHEAMLQSLGFKVEVIVAPYNGKQAYWVYCEEIKPDAERRLRKGK